jgi:hypothetical protein
LKAWTTPNFDSLIDLSHRDGVDIRPTLLRVITDSYLQCLLHGPDDERQYTELALRLLDETDMATRAAASARLAHEAAVPRPIVLRLARDVIEVAEPILRYSPVLTAEDRAAIARERGPVYAHILAERERAARPVAAGTIENKAVDGDEIGDAEELTELFFAAGSSERKLILFHLDYAAIEPMPPVVALHRADVWRLETAALRHETDAVMREVQRALGVSQTLARRIVHDELGEPIAVAGKAMNLPADVLQRMILFLNPAVGHSVDRVYELAGLYREITVDAARRLVAIWRGADRGSLRPTRHESQPWRHAAENARRALSRISRVNEHQPQPRALARMG